MSMLVYLKYQLDLGGLMDIRERIFQLCRKHNVTPTRLAEISCLTQSTINNITSGRNKTVRLSTIEKICDGLNITLIDFFETERRPDLPLDVADELIEYEKYLMAKYNLDKK